MRDVVIVAHGSPSDPVPQETALTAIAERIAQVAPNGRLRSATLAADGALARAVKGLKHPLIYPWFMTNGWFVSTNLPRRLAKAGLDSFDILPSLGLEPALPDCAKAALRARITGPKPTLVLAAHGSPSDPRPRAATLAFAAELEASDLFAAVRTGFVDEAPSIEDAARAAPDAVVLPFFAARAGHVLMDMPDALAAAGHHGPVLDPIGTWDATVELAGHSISDAIRNLAA